MSPLRTRVGGRVGTRNGANLVLRARDLVALSRGLAVLLVRTASSLFKGLAPAILEQATSRPRIRRATRAELRAASIFLKPAELDARRLSSSSRRPYLTAGVAMACPHLAKRLIPTDRATGRGLALGFVDRGLGRPTRRSRVRFRVTHSRTRDGQGRIDGARRRRPRRTGHDPLTDPLPCVGRAALGALKLRATTA